MKIFKMYLLKKINVQFYSKYIKKQIATGISEFKELVKSSSIIVDKSLLIKEFIEDYGQTLLMTYPRRWGKSINLDMIKTFFEIEVDENGNTLNKKNRENYKIFFENEKFQFQILNSEIIFKQEKYSPKELQGEYPVILIDFKATKGKSYEEVLSFFKGQLIELFLKYEYLLESKRLHNYDIITYKKCIEDPSIQELSKGIYYLSKFLNKHFNKRVIILVDEYDAAINNAYINFKNEEEAEKVISLFRNILENTFKGNEYLEKGLITGKYF